MEDNCGIYKITSPLGRIYVGKTINFTNRFKDYLKLKCKSQYRLYNSFLKHGVENHNFEVIIYCKENELNEKEIFYIKEFNSFNTDNGLNLTSGGGGGKLSDESKRKMSETQKKKGYGKDHYLFGRKQSEEHRKNLSIARIGDKNPMFGKKQSPETIQKRVQKLIGKKRTQEQINNFSGINHPRFGKKASDETRRKISLSKKGVKLSEKARENVVRALTGRKKSIEARRKQSIAQKGKKKNYSEEQRKVISENSKRVWRIIKEEKALMIF